jgi:hypothetical protein
MKTILIKGGARNNTAVKILTHHLLALGHIISRNPKLECDVTVSWGTSTDRKPNLNGQVNRYNKYTCFAAFDKLGVLHPTVFASHDALHRWRLSPWLARNYHHSKGKDIVVCKTYREVIEAVPHRDFFSVFIPTKTEYRVWVFQDKTLAVYEKVYKGKGEYEGFMRNQRFGFKFVKRDDLRDSPLLKSPSINAVKALDMDFGAVDIIEGKDNKAYVLEVNSMPHIETIDRSSGIRLAASISKWAEGQ